MTRADDDDAGVAGVEEWRRDRADDDDAGVAGVEEWRRDRADDDDAGVAGPAPRAGGTPMPDPWKSFRGVMAGTLILEAIVVLLALPVVGTVGGGLTSVALGYLIGLAAVLVLLAGLQGRSWAVRMNLAVQLIPIAGFVVYPGMGFIGILFAAVWALIAYLRAEVLRREKRGLLPGQGARPQGVEEVSGEGGPPPSREVPPPAGGGQRRWD